MGDQGQHQGGDSTIMTTPTPDPILYLIKTMNTGTPSIEVHGVDKNSLWQSFVIQTGTGFPASDGPLGKWAIDGSNLYFIKTQGTGGSIELEEAPAPGYQKVGLNVATEFTEADATNGHWRVDNGMLCFIKTNNCGSGHVEVHRVAEPDWTNVLHFVTDVPQEQAAQRCTWRIHNGYLFWIRQVGGQVGVTFWTASSSYKTATFYPIEWFDYDPYPNDTWDIGPGADLYRIQTPGPDLETMDIIRFLFANKYQHFQGSHTAFKVVNAGNGVWTVR